VALAGHDTVLAFTPELVRLYFTSVSEQGAKMATLHRKRAVLGRFATWGQRHKLWVEDPMALAPKIKRPDDLPRPFSQDEIRRLWALPVPPVEALFRALLYYTGLRVSEICAIRLGDLTREPPTVTIIGKGGKPQVRLLHERLAEQIQSYVLERTDLRAATPLLMQASGRPWNRRIASKITARWGRLAKVEACVPHRFRHTFGTSLLEAVGDLRIVQEAMGHADIKSTMKYTQVRNARLRDAIQQLPSPGA
jgi:integrase/recombinase XerD